MDADKISNQVLINMRARIKAENTRKTLKTSLQSKMDMTNRIQKFVDCRSKDVNEREVFIVEAVEGPEDYPMREFLDNGLLVTVNTDNRTVSNTSISRELGFIQETYGIRDDELKLMMENAVRVSFAGDSVKDRILKEIRAFG